MIGLRNRCRRQGDVIEGSTTGHPTPSKERHMTEQQSAQGHNGISRRGFMAKSLKYGMGLTVLASGGGLLAACADDQDPEVSGPTASPARERLGEIAYTTPFGFIPSFFLIYAAAGEGYWDDEGLGVHVRGGQGTATAVQAVAGSSVDISSVGGMNSIQAIANEGFELVNIGQYNQESLFSVVSLPDAPIRSPEELVGKRVGVWSAGGATEMIVDVLAGVAGADGSSIERPIVGGGPAGYAFLERGEVDAWIAEEPDLRTLERDGAAVFDFNPDEFAPIPDMAFLTRRAYVEEQPEILEAYLRGIRRSMEFCSDEGNHDRVVEHMAEFNPDVNRDDVKFQLPILVEKLTAGGKFDHLALDQGRWERGQQLMVDAGLVDSAVPVENLIDSSILDRL